MFFSGPHLTEIEWEEFFYWAFGLPITTKICPANLYIRWNKIHSDKLVIAADDSVSKTIPKMIELFKNERISQ